MVLVSVFADCSTCNFWNTSITVSVVWTRKHLESADLSHAIKYATATSSLQNWRHIVLTIKGDTFVYSVKERQWTVILCCTYTAVLSILHITAKILVVYTKPCTKVLQLLHNQIIQQWAHSLKHYWYIQCQHQIVKNFKFSLVNPND